MNQFFSVGGGGCLNMEAYDSSYRMNIYGVPYHQYEQKKII